MITYYNAVLTDLRAVLGERDITELRTQYANLTKKVDELERTKWLLRGYMRERNKRNVEIDLFLKDTVEANKRDFNADRLSEAAKTIREHYTAQDDDYLECVRKFVEAINMEVDLSCLEQFLPNVKE